MALQHSPRIVTDGLVLCLDAANPKSYPGSGSTWNDLSGMNNHVTLYNTPTFSAGNLVFNGTNQYGRTTSTLDLSGTAAITVLSCWKTPTTSTEAMVYEHTNNWNAVTNGYGGFGIYTNSTGTVSQSGTMHIQLRGNTNYAGVNVAAPISTSFQMYSVVHDFSASGSSDKETLAYINGTFFTPTASYNSNNTNTGFGNDYLYIGSRGGSSAFSNFTLSFLMMYARRLSVSEITQHYNSLRGRFGL